MGLYLRRRVRLSSANAEAVTAINEFPRFQITGYRTGSPKNPVDQ